MVAFSIAAAISRYFHETFVQRQIVPYRVLPSFFVLLIVRKLGRDVLVNFRQCDAFVRRILNGHGNQSHVRVRWFIWAGRRGQSRRCGLLWRLLLLLLLVRGRRRTFLGRPQRCNRIATDVARKHTAIISKYIQNIWSALNLFVFFLSIYNSISLLYA